MSKLNLTSKIKGLRGIKSAMLETMANNAINHFKVTNFEAQGFVDSTVTPWAPRKSKAKKDQGRKILVKTGRLRASISVQSRSVESIVVGSNVPYAEYINEGTKNMVKREFIGDSKKLREENQKVVERYLDRL